MTKRITRRILGWLAVSLIALCTAGFTWLAMSSVMDKGAAIWAQALLVLAGLGGTSATLVLNKDRPARGMPLREWLEPKPLAAVFVAILGGFSAMSLALPLFEPRTAVESAPGAIEAKIDRLTLATPQPVRIREKIVGVWGEPGCAVTYRFALRDDALTVDAERRPEGAPPWRLVTTVTKAEGDVLHAVGETPAEAKGDAVTYTYSSGGVERLTWDDQGGEVPLELGRC